MNRGHFSISAVKEISGKVTLGFKIVLISLFLSPISFHEQPLGHLAVFSRHWGAYCATLKAQRK